MFKQLELSVTQAWYQGSRRLSWLRPLSIGFGLAVKLRRAWYKRQTVPPLPVPVIIIGNISVGGSGKTPVVIALAQALKERGFNPGIISRGYGAKKSAKPVLATAQSNYQEVGDEPLLIAQKTHVPVMVGANRRASVHALLELDPTLNVILSDDGLQHYQLPRFKEIVMVDPQLGSRKMLPEGPLREPISRLNEADYRLGSGSLADYDVCFDVEHFYIMQNPETKIPLSELKHKTVHAVAAIARPERFFHALRAKGLNVIEHRFADHAIIQAKDLAWEDDFPVLMTEKDAVKCPQISKPIGVVCLQATLPNLFIEMLIKDLHHG